MNMKGFDVSLILAVVVVAAVALIEASSSVLIALKDKQKDQLICGNQTQKISYKKKLKFNYRENNHINFFFHEKSI